MVIRTRVTAVVFGLLLSAIGVAGCQSTTPIENNSKKTILVTYSILGAVIKDLVGDSANVLVLIPNGQDPHEWEPSAKDMERLMQAGFIVQNGLGLEGGLEKSLAQAKSNGSIIFIASDYVPIRKVKSGEGIPAGGLDQATGASDPHLWMDPIAVQKVMDALAIQLKTNWGLDVSSRAKDLDQRLGALDQDIANSVSAIPEKDRKLVTGHESMGYFADRYGFQLVGAMIPNLSTQAEVSASDLAQLKAVIQANHVRAIFTELGTPRSISDAIGQETGVEVIQVSTHVLPDDGSYFTFMRALAEAIVFPLMEQP
jgi:zinc/manganese transport system substrate-binding protein